MNIRRAFYAITAMTACFVVRVHGDLLDVGPGRAYSSIEDACAAASAFDTIDVFPRDNDEPYLQVALYVTKPDIFIRGRAAGSAAACGLYAGRRIGGNGHGTAAVHIR